MKKPRLNKRAFEMAVETLDGTYSVWPHKARDLARCILITYLMQIKFIEDEKK